MNMPAHKIVNLDCRGMRCPEPILAIAKAMRDLRGEPGQLLISADDEAFPGDLKSWARSARAQIVALTPDGQLHQATIIVNAPAPAPPPTATITPAAQTLPRPPQLAATPAQEDKKLLNCMGMKCPEQVIALAKLAKNSPLGQIIEIQADEESFAMDLKSWARSAKAQILTMDTSQGRCFATIQLVGGTTPALTPAPATQAPARSPQPQGIAAAAASAASAAAPTPQAAPQRSTPRIKLDLRADSTPQLLQRLQGLSHAQLPADTELELLLNRPDPLPQIAQWIIQEQHQLAQVHMDTNPVRLIIRTGAPLLQVSVEPLERTATSDQERCALMVRRNDLESLMHTMIIANAAAAKGMVVEIFFSFAGIELLKRRRAQPSADDSPSWLGKLRRQAPKPPAKHPDATELRFMSAARRLLNKQRITTLEQLVQAAIDRGVRFKVCTMSMKLVGLSSHKLLPLPNLEFVEDDTFIESAKAAELGVAF